MSDPNYPNQLTPQQVAAIQGQVQAWVQQHPDVQARLSAGDTAGASYLLRSQYQIDIPAGYSLNRDGTLKYVNVTDPWFARNLSWLGPMIVGGGAAGVGLLAAGGGAAAAAGSSAAGASGAAGSTLPASSIPIAYAPGAAATSAGALGSSVAGTAGAAGAAGAAAGTVPGYGVPSGLTATSEGVNIAAPTAAGGSGWDRLANIARNPIVGAAGDALRSTADAQANNRGVQLEADIARAQLDQQAERDVNSANIARSQDDRAGQKSAWEMLNHASYVKNAPTNLNTTNFSPYSRSVEGPSADARAGAEALTGQTRDDLMSGRFRTNGGAPLPMPQRVGTGVTVQQPGALETWGGALGSGLTAWDRLARLRGLTAPTNPQPTSRPY